jgi:hypothetical protein
VPVGVTDLARAALLAVMPLVWLLGLLTLLLLLIVALFGTVSQINDAASRSFVPGLVPGAQLQRALARLDGADAVAQTGRPRGRRCADPDRRCATVGVGGRRQVPVLGRHGGHVARCQGTTLDNEVWQVIDKSVGASEL